jgi:hypothetical protein
VSGNLFGWSDALWTLIDQVGMLLGLGTGLLTLGGLALALIRPAILRRWFLRNRFRHVGDDLAEGETWDGLVFTVSKPDLPILVLHRLRPAHLGLIASAQSRPHAEAIQREAASLGIAAHGIVEVNNPDDPAEARDQAKALLGRLRTAGAGRCAVDVTGGKTPMSLGAFMAAEKAGCSTLYLASRYDDKLQRPDPASSRLNCISRAE